MPFHSILIVLVHVAGLVSLSVYSVFSFPDARIWAAVWSLPVFLVGIRACFRGRLVCGGPYVNSKLLELDLSKSPKEFYLCMWWLAGLAWIIQLVPMCSL
jgi:hypothetical protein